jgi:hypothetical protein
MTLFFVLLLVAAAALPRRPPPPKQNLFFQEETAPHDPRDSLISGYLFRGCRSTDDRARANRRSSETKVRLRSDMELEGYSTLYCSRLDVHYCTAMHS